VTSASKRVLLVDLSSIAHPIWHTSQSAPNPDTPSAQIVTRVRTLAAQSPYVAVCCDSRRSFRKDLAPSYKANREPQEAPFRHQVDLAVEALAADGFPIWTVDGFEADDVIASATVQALTFPDVDVVIVSADKDLLQLIGPRVTAKSVRDGSTVDADAVVAKFGVRPDQMLDYLTLVGDASDNVTGVKGVGPVRAANLLGIHGTLAAVYDGLEVKGSATDGLTPAIAAALSAFRPHLETTQKLLTLRTDVELPFDEVFKDRTARAPQTFDFADEDAMTPDVDSPAEPVAADAPSTGPTLVPSSDAPAPATEEAPAPTTIAKRDPDVLAPAPAEWERQLDPRSMGQAQALAMNMFKAAMFGGYGNPQAVLSTIMVGRELGIPAMTSLRCIHNIEGRHGLSAQLVVALVLKSGFAEFFEMVELTETSCTYETKRKGARAPLKLTHTLDMARQAGLIKPKSNWETVPQDMLVARCSVRLARIAYPDIVANVYTPDELAEIRDNARVA
jgi:5'-3' exonuclease